MQTFTQTLLELKENGRESLNEVLTVYELSELQNRAESLFYAMYDIEKVFENCDNNEERRLYLQRNLSAILEALEDYREIVIEEMKAYQMQYEFDKEIEGLSAK